MVLSDEPEAQISLTTRLGQQCLVQLLLGDITDLEVENKVDLIYTSAFPGDYSAGYKGTLIGALRTKLGVSVAQLAKGKDLDLRKNFSCWVSQPLPSDLPYRRLVCLEINRDGATLTEQISMMFRAMMPIFNCNDSTIITPVLASGCQRLPLEEMMCVMVNTACHWIKAGLPLRCLKLVLYCNNLDQARKYTYAKAIELFKKVKLKWESKELDYARAQSFDICFCYHIEDKHWVEKISASLLEQDKDLSIHSDHFQMNEKDPWQEEIFNIMSQSKRIVCVLTPKFVSNAACLEQFNMGLCCNKLQMDSIVIPFYVETVETFPSYMTLVQYRECRARKEDETVQEKISSACSELIKVIRHPEPSYDQSLLNTSGMSEKDAMVYDIFVSYSHRNSAMATAFVKILEDEHPDLTIFYDRSELKSGNLWQQALYEAVDKTRCMVMFLSDSYLNSTVCQEEFNITVGRQCAKSDFHVVPVCLPELTKVPAYYSQKQFVSVASEGDVRQLIKKLVPVVMEDKNKTDIDSKTTVLPIFNSLSRSRQLDLKDNFIFDNENKELKRKNSKPLDTSLVKGTVTFSYVHDGLKLSAILSEMLKMQSANIVPHLLSPGQTETRKEIDNADIVVAFVSDEYLASKHHMEELHIALCKQRVIKDSTVVYLIELNHKDHKLFYPHILPYNLSMKDHLWTRLGKKMSMDFYRFNIHTQGMQGTYSCSSAEYVALQKATIDILGHLSQRGQGSSLCTNILNIRKVRAESKGKVEEDVTLNKVTVLIKDFNLFTSTEEDSGDDKEEFEDDAEFESTNKEKANMDSKSPQNEGEAADNVMNDLSNFFASGGKLKTRGKSYEDLTNMVNVNASSMNSESAKETQKDVPTKEGDIASDSNQENVKYLQHANALKKMEEECLQFLDDSKSNSRKSTPGVKQSKTNPGTEDGKASKPSKACHIV